VPIAIDPALRRRVDDAVQTVLPAVTAFRHERHAAPELTWQEVETARAVAARLREIPGLTVREGVGRHGVVAELEGARPGPTIALRADMDALPIREVTGKPYASCKEGVMHACGHDGHMANLLGSAMVLASLRDELRGRVRLIFQPAEEGGAGADVMCKDGVLEGVDAIFGLHGWPELAAGEIGVRSGALMASTTELKITVRGTGCHAAMPHLGTDQVLIACRIVEALQSIRSRFTAPADPVALSISTIHGGTASNVLPAAVELTGTLRTMSVSTRERCSEAIKRLVEGIAAAHGAKAEVRIEHNYPPTVNHDAATAFIEAVAREVMPAPKVRRLDAPTMGGEDFAFFLQRIQGSYFFLGVGDGREGGYPSLHHPGFDFNDAALPVGMKVFVHAALAYAGGPLAAPV
jgi:amidohydrolase